MNRDQEAGPKQRGVEGHGQRSRSLSQIERSGRTWTEIKIKSLSCIKRGGRTWTEIKKLVPNREEWKDMDRDQEACPV